MSIVKMKRLELVGLTCQRDEFLRILQPMGCVEFSDPSEILSDPAVSRLLRPETGSKGDWEAEILRFERALGILKAQQEEKSPMFPKRKQVSAGELMDEAVHRRASDAAEQLLQLEAQMEALRAEESRLEGEILSLTPWETMELPLDYGGTRCTEMVPVRIPGSIPIEDYCRALDETGTEIQLIPVSREPLLTCCMAFYHRAQASQAQEALRRCGGEVALFPEKTGLARENLSALREALRQTQQKREQLKAGIRGLGGTKETLQMAWDRAQQLVRREEAKAKLLTDGRIFTMTGWIPAKKVEKLDSLLAEFCVAYEVRDPAEGDDVPTLLENNRFTRPLMMVTEMYALPAYDGVDPNPLMFPFFTIFFGIMFADMGYGLLLLLFWALGTFKWKPKGTVGYMVGLCGICGATTFLFGALTGGFFGDAIPVIAGMYGKTVTIPALISPLENPMVVLIGALVIGIIHILTGMAIGGYMLIRDGHWKDAVMDIGSWWLLFAGIALGAVGITWYVAIAGVLALICTQGRSKPTFFGKLIGGIASLYDVTSYLGDILSYSRLMALMLAGGVIASIMNTLGSFTGGILGFIPIFLIGHALNIGLNVLGCYVHTSRLMYLEYFGKFYKDGGRAFRPLEYNTKYVDIREEQ